MPKRQNVIEVDTTDVQGEDSWVKIKAVSYGEMRVLQQHSGSSDPEKMAAVEAAVKANVVRWNWVDDDGEPLPQIADNPDIIYTLTQHEYMALVKALAGSMKDRKN